MSTTPKSSNTLYQDIVKKLDAMVTGLLSGPTNDVLSVIGSSDMYDNPFNRVFGFLGSDIAWKSSEGKLAHVFGTIRHVRFVGLVSLICGPGGTLGGHWTMDADFVDSDDFWQLSGTVQPVSIVALSTACGGDQWLVRAVQMGNRQILTEPVGTLGDANWLVKIALVPRFSFFQCSVRMGSELAKFSHKAFVKWAGFAWCENISGHGR